MNLAVLVMPGEQVWISVMVRYWEVQSSGASEKRPPMFYGRPVTGSEAGLNGAYLLNSSVPRAKDKPEWVFKPRSQEAEKAGQALKSGVVRGTSCIKEVAAFVVDHDGFAGVPETRAMVIDVQLAKSRIVDFGSLQRFIEHEGSCEEYGSSLFEADNIHRIALLDLRIGNCDRHEGNILVVRDKEQLRAVPIDHGYCLPSWRELSDLYFCWSSWRQAKMPLSQETKKYMLAQKPLLDIMDLLEIGIDHDSVMTYVLCSLFVQRAISAGLNLSEIAGMMQRSTETDFPEPSTFEQLVSEAAFKTGFDDFHLSTSMDWNLPVVRDFLKQFVLRTLLFLAPYQDNQYV